MRIILRPNLAFDFVTRRDLPREYSFTMVHLQHRACGNRAIIPSPLLFQVPKTPRADRSGSRPKWATTSSDLQAVFHKRQHRNCSLDPRISGRVLSGDVLAGTEVPRSEGGGGGGEGRRERETIGRFSEAGLLE